MQTNKIYPHNLLEAILFEEDVSRYADNPDCVAGLEYALTTLDDRLCQILECRYEKNMTFASIGEIFGISRSRADQLHDKAIRRLHHPTRYKYIAYGLEGARRADEADEKEKRQKFEEDRANFANLSYTILEERLDARSYNRLCYYHYTECYRKGIELTIGMIDAMSDEKLRSIRNLGQISSKKIRKAIEDLKAYYGLTK